MGDDPPPKKKSRFFSNECDQGHRYKSSRNKPEGHSEAETGLGSNSEDENDGNRGYDESDVENAKPDTRNRRREAMYGLKSLLPAGSTLSAQQAIPTSSSLYTPRQPDLQHLAQSPYSTIAPVPPGSTYAFGAGIANPYANGAGGQYSFNFSTARALAIPPKTQYPSYSLYQHQVGSGLTRIAQQSMHNDTGPLYQRQGQAQHSLVPSLPVLQGLPKAPVVPYIDVDRDENGRRLSTFRTPRPPAHHGIFSLQNTAHLAANADTQVPEHIYTSPNRIERAQNYARVSLKRKRPEAILPPPSFLYQCTGSPNFNIFNGVLLYPELCFALASHLSVKDLISLYAISKDFHVILDTRFTTVILSQATRKAPESARTFLFRSHAHLCRSDPAARSPHPNSYLAEQNIPRRIPSFRWLKMVLHREKVIHEILTIFAEDGIPLPARCSLALKRLWFMLDIPDNARRIGYVHNKSLMTDLDLYFSACFFTKLDMRLNDPISGEKRDGMRKLLLAQRSFTTILCVLKHEALTTRYDILKEWVRLKYTPAEDELSLKSIFGIPIEQVGKKRLEFWGLKSAAQMERTPAPLLRPDQLIVREAFKRGMRFDKHYLRFMLYGYVRPDTLEDYAPRTYGRRIAMMRDDEYEVDDVVGGVAALGVGDGGFDPLLDLGTVREVSKFTIVKEEMSRGEMKVRRREREFLDQCVGWWETERKRVRKRSDLSSPELGHG